MNQKSIDPPVGMRIDKNLVIPISLSISLIDSFDCHWVLIGSVFRVTTIAKQQ